MAELKKKIYSSENLYTSVSDEVAEYEFENSKIQNGGPKNGRILKKFDSSKTLYSLVFEFAEYEFEIEIRKIKNGEPEIAELKKI